MTKAISSLSDTTFYAFCQGAIHYKRGNINRRPLVIYAALGGMIVNFTRRQVLGFTPPKLGAETACCLRQAGATALHGIGTELLAKEDQAVMLDQAQEIFCTPDEGRKRSFIEPERRGRDLRVPSKTDCHKIFYHQRPDDLQDFMCRIDELIIARPSPQHARRQAQYLP